MLKRMMGTLEFVMELELSAERKLAQADVNEVMIKLEDEGFYLQMPPKDKNWFDKLFTETQARSDAD